MVALAQGVNIVRRELGLTPAVVPVEARNLAYL